MFTTQFKVLVASILVLVLFLGLGFNQVLLSKKIEQANQNTQSALELNQKTLSVVDKLLSEVTPTPTIASKSAIKILVVTPSPKITPKPTVKK